MSDSKAGSMAASMMWAFAIGSAVAGAVLGWFVPGWAGFLVGAAIFVGGGWAAVYMTQSSTGKGIVGMLVAALVAGIIGFIMLKTMTSAAISGAGGQAFNDAMKQAQAQGGTQLTAEQQAALANAGGAIAGGMAGILGFLGALVKTFLFGMVGCFIGGSMKKSAVGASGAVSKAA